MPVSRKTLRLPRFVAGVAAMPAGERCWRCQGPVEPAAEARAFEDARPLCDLCALEHAPPFIVRSLLAEGKARLDRQTRPDYLRRIATREAVERAYLDELSASEAEALLWSLHGLYPEALDPIAEQLGVRHWEQLLVAGERWPQEDDEDDVLENLDAALRLSPVERLRAAEVWAALEGRRFEELHAELSALEPRFRTPALYHRLAEASQQLLRETPRRARELAELAQTALAALDPELLGAEAVADLEADAWARLGNARRVTCDLAGADAALETALEHYRRGSRRWRRKAEILDFQGSLRRDQRRFDEAHVCLDRALAIYRACQEPELVAKVLINKAMTFQHSCQPERSIPLLQQTLAMIDGDSQPEILFITCHNLMDCLCDCQDFRQARSLLKVAKLLARERGQPTDLTRLSWVAGKIEQGSGRHLKAEGLLLRAHREFIAANDPCSAALTALDLALLYLATGRIDKMRHLAVEVIKIFESRNIHREALAALEIFRYSLEVGNLTPTLARQLERYFKQGWNSPNMNFSTIDALGEAGGR